MKSLQYLKDVSTLTLTLQRCTGCGMCLTVCPQAVFAKAGKKVEIVEKDNCMECGACLMNCPSEALAVEVGVGCALAVLNSLLGRKDSPCCS